MRTTAAPIPWVCFWKPGWWRLAGDSNSIHHEEKRDEKRERERERETKMKRFWGKVQVRKRGERDRERLEETRGRRKKPPLQCPAHIKRWMMFASRAAAAKRFCQDSLFFSFILYLLSLFFPFFFYLFCLVHSMHLSTIYPVIWNDPFLVRLLE